MAINYQVKKEKYQSAISQLNYLLKNGEYIKAKEVLGIAEETLIDLINNTLTKEIKDQYLEQQKKLKLLENELANGKTDFFNKQKTEQPQTINTSTQENVSLSSEFFSSETPSLRLCDIAGLNEVKEEIRLSVLAPLNDRETYFKYCDDVGSRILLYGPPGCGKSFIAEAIAGELGCAYCVINVSDILDKYVGNAPQKIALIFEEAKKYKKRLIFFDEMDALFSNRESEESKHTKDIVNAILPLLSGFAVNKDEGICVIIGATNRPWAIDPALLRGGRLDTQIYVGLPDYEARMFIINKALKNHDFLLDSSDITVDEICNKLEGSSGADIKSIFSKLKKRVLQRALENKERNIEKEEKITRADFEYVMAGYRNSITKEMISAFELFRKGEL